MTDLRKAAEQALESLERLDKWLALRYGNELTPPEREVVKALRQALQDKPPVKSYCGGKPNYCTPVDAVNMSQERVDETAKGGHEPWPSVQCVCGETIYFKYTPPIFEHWPRLGRRIQSSNT